MVIKAILIGIAAFLGASFLEKTIGGTGAKGAASIAKAVIYTVAAFMILSQLGFASVIVNYAFIISLSALAVAFAVAFGIGGRDFAKKTLDSVRLGSEKGEKETAKENGDKK